MKTVFVDGYNVLNVWPNLKDVKNSSFEIARQKLVDALQNYSMYKGYKVILVFDAHMVSGSLLKKERITENFMVVFTKEGETADAYIEKIVNDIGRKNEVCVVTSDSLEQQVIFGRGASRMSSYEFYFEVKSIEEKISVKINTKYSDNRCTIEERVERDILEKLQKIRKS